MRSRTMSRAEVERVKADMRRLRQMNPAAWRAWKSRVVAALAVIEEIERRSSPEDFDRWLRMQERRLKQEVWLAQRSARGHAAK